MLYDIGWINSQFVEHVTGSPPWATQSRVTNAPSLVLPLVFPPAVVGRSLRTIDWNSEQPYLIEYSLAVDQQMPGGMGLAVAYVGSHAYDLPACSRAIPVPTILSDGTYYWADNAPTVNPYWADVLWKSTGARTVYNSLQLSLNKPLSRGVQFRARTPAKMTSNVINAQLNGDQGGSGNAMKPNPYEDDPGPVQWDIRHNVKINAITTCQQAASGSAGGR